MRDITVRTKLNDTNGRGWHTCKHGSSSYKEVKLFPSFFSRVPRSSFLHSVRLNLTFESCLRERLLDSFRNRGLGNQISCALAIRVRIKDKARCTKTGLRKAATLLFPRKRRVRSNASANLINIYSGLPVDIKWLLPNNLS